MDGHSCAECKRRPLVMTFLQVDLGTSGGDGAPSARSYSSMGPEYNGVPV